MRYTVANPAVLLKHIIEKLAVMIWTDGLCTCTGPIGGIVLARTRTFSSVKAEIKIFFFVRVQILTKHSVPHNFYLLEVESFQFNVKP